LDQCAGGKFRGYDMAKCVKARVLMGEVVAGPAGQVVPVDTVLTTHPVNPLEPGPKIKLKVRHNSFESVQYEFYIPAAIWSHRAVLKFISELENITQGATIQKTATGVWQGEEEDTNIYRMIVRPKKGTIETMQSRVRARLRNAIGEMMVTLAEWGESYQSEFMFTEVKLLSTTSEITDLPVQLRTKYRKMKDAKRALRRREHEVKMATR